MEWLRFLMYCVMAATMLEVAFRVFKGNVVINTNESVWDKGFVIMVYAFAAGVFINEAFPILFELIK